MLLGYNTNGFAHHRLEDAIEILAELGYRSVALTMDYHALNPYEAGYAEQVRRVGGILRSCGLRCVIETGARFLLDRMHKHRPTLLDLVADVRFDFLRRAVDLAAELHADAVSFWSGTAATTEPNVALMERLTDRCRRLAEYAGNSVRLAFEPEPGMFIDTMAKYEELFNRVNHPSFGLTLDVGHLHCLGEVPTRPHVLQWAKVLWNVHIEDMRAGVHDHLMFGEGELDFPEVVSALVEANYAGGLHVELSRHSHDAVRTAIRAEAFLRQLLG